MKREEAIELVQDFITEKLPQEDWYQHIQPHIKAIVFYGSRAKETNREDSDVDILIILPLEIEKKYTTGEYVYEHKGFEVNIVLRSIERMRSIAEAGADQESAEPFVRSKVIWSADDEVDNLIKKITAL